MDGRSWMVEPSAILFSKKGVSVGHSLITNIKEVRLTNLSKKSQFIPSGTRLARLEELTEWETLAINSLAETSNVEEPTEIDSIQEELNARINNDLDPDEKARLSVLLYKHKDCFASNKRDLGHCSILQHKILTGDAKPIHQAPYPSAFKQRELLQSQISEMLQDGIIEPSCSPWSSPVVLVKKKDGSWRFCADFRKLNNLTIKDVYPLPRIDDALSRLNGAQFFSIMDMQSGFWQLEVHPDSIEKTAFVTPDGLWQFKKMPFGLCNSPASFQRMMDIVLSGIKWSACLIYLDDVIVFGRNLQEHRQRLDTVLGAIKGAGLRLKTNKCSFGETSLKMLGHIVDKDGINPDPAKIQAVEEFPRPMKVKDIQGFIGLCSYYRKFIPEFAEKARPLTSLTKSTVIFDWGDEQEDSYVHLKQSLASCARLSHPDYTRTMIIHPDASGYGLGAVLLQTIDGKEKPLGFASRLLKGSELNYSITEKECLAAVWALQKFRYIVWGCEIVIVTDHHALCWLLSKKDLAGRLARWALLIQGEHIQIVHKSGKKHTDADALSRYPISGGNAEVDEENGNYIPLCALNTGETSGVNERLNLSKVAEAQRLDVHWAGIINLLLSQEKATTQQRRRLQGFVLRKGVLFKRAIKQEIAQHRTCLPKAMIEEIMATYHDDIMTGHMGQSRTLHAITQRFFWPSMAKDIINYVRSCQSCQMRKSIPKKPAGLLTFIEVQNPFEKIGIDLLGPFPTTTARGNNYIVVAVDYLTKWAETASLKTGTAYETAQFLIDRIILQHGAPASIISDRGKCFIAELTQNVLKILKVNHQTTTSYHPQANGLCERLNHTLADMLSMYVDADHKNWDEVLPYVTFAYNISKQESTRYTPFYLLYGREAVLPTDLSFDVESNMYVATESNQDYAVRITKNLTEAREEVRENLRRVHLKQKSEYDNRRRDASYRVGDLVLIYKPFRKVGKSEKLLHRWLGPYEVIRQTSDLNYEVKLQNDKKRKSDIVHVVNMKLFHPQINKGNTLPALPDGEMGALLTQTGSTKKDDSTGRSPRSDDNGYK